MCSVCGYIILYKNKHIIVHLTEILVSYIPKINVYHGFFTAGIVAETILPSASYWDRLEKEA